MFPYAIHFKNLSLTDIEELAALRAPSQGHKMTDKNEGEASICEQINRCLTRSFLVLRVELRLLFYGHRKHLMLQPLYRKDSNRYTYLGEEKGASDTNKHSLHEASMVIPCSCTGRQCHQSKTCCGDSYISIVLMLSMRLHGRRSRLSVLTSTRRHTYVSARCSFSRTCFTSRP